MNKTNNRFFAYIFVSDPKQKKGASLDAQPKDLIKFAEENAFVIVDWFNENETAAKTGGRPIYNDMIERLKKGEAKGLLCHKVDRSARNIY